MHTENTATNIWCLTTGAVQHCVHTVVLSTSHLLFQRRNEHYLEVTKETERKCSFDDFFCIDCSLKVTFLWDKSRFWTTGQDRKLVLSRERKDISRDHLPQDSKTETSAASGLNDYHPVTSKTTSLSVRTLICMRSEPTGPQRMPYPLPATQSEHTLKSTATSETVLLISAQRSTQSNPGSWLEPPRALC